MNFKSKIYVKGFRVKWVAEQIDENYNSLRTYLNNENIMPMHVQEKLKDILK